MEMSLMTRKKICRDVHNDIPKHAQQQKKWGENSNGDRVLNIKEKKTIFYKRMKPCNNIQRF